MGRFQRASAAAVAEGEKSLSFELAVPAKAKRKKNDPRDARWTAMVRIAEINTEEVTTQKGDDNLVVEVKGEIIEGLDDAGENLGRTVSMRARLNYDAWNEGDTKNGQFKMHRRSIGTISQLLRAAGLYAGGDIEEDLFETAFPESGQGSPILGQTLGCEIHQGPNQDDKIFPEISAWLVPDTATPVAAGQPAGSGVVSL